MTDVQKMLLKLAAGGVLVVGGAIVGGLGTKKIKEGADDFIDLSGQFFKGFNLGNNTQATPQIAKTAAETVQTLADGTQKMVTETTDGILDSYFKPGNIV